MRLRRKVSEKRYYGKAVYRSEQFLLPIPAKYREHVRPFYGRDLKVSVEVDGEGFVVRVIDRINLPPPTRKCK